VTRDKNLTTGGKLLADAVLIEARGPWKIHCSESERTVQVQTTDYHPGILKPTQHDFRLFTDMASE
jgi:hypothetical protein